MYAENEVLRYLADLAGLPPAAGGCFVSGGSAGNLSALFAAREAAAARRGSRPDRWRVVVGEEAHSSISSTLRILDCEPVVVRSGADDRFTGDALEAVLTNDPDPSSICAIAATAGTTNAGIVDDLAGIAGVARARRDLAARGRRVRRRCALRAELRGRASLASSTQTPSSSTRTSGCYAPFDSCALLYREPSLARAAHAQQASYLDPMRDPSRARAHGTRPTTRTT